MNTQQRILTCRLLSKMDRNKTISVRLGLEDTTRYVLQLSKEVTIKSNTHSRTTQK